MLGSSQLLLSKHDIGVKPYIILPRDAIDGVHEELVKTCQERFVRASCSECKQG